MQFVCSCLLLFLLLFQFHCHHLSLSYFSVWCSPLNFCSVSAFASAFAQVSVTFRVRLFQSRFWNSFFLCCCCCVFCVKFAETKIDSERSRQSLRRQPGRQFARSSADLLQNLEDRQALSVKRNKIKYKWTD